MDVLFLCLELNIKIENAWISSLSTGRQKWKYTVVFDAIIAIKTCYETIEIRLSSFSARMVGISLKELILDVLENV